MKHLLLVATVLCLSAVTVATLLVLKDFDKLIVDADAAVRAEQKDLHGTSQNVNAILIQAGLAADQARLAALEQRQYWNRTAIETDKTVKAARKIIDRTGQQLNDETLPAVTDAVSALRFATEEIEYQASNSLQTIPVVMKSADQTLADIDKLTINSDLLGTLRNVQGITANVNSTTKMVDGWVARETKPPTIAQRILGLTVDLAPGGYGIYRALHP